MLHKGSDRHFVATSVATSGRSLNLGKGQFAIVDVAATPTNDGLKVISDFKGLAKDAKVQLFLGSASLTPNRSVSNKSWRSLDFKLSEIESLRVSAPKEGIHVDEQILGYNGHDDDTAIVLEAGDNEEISIKLSGPSMAMLGYEDGCTIVKEYLTAPSTTKAADQTAADNGAWTDHEVVEKAVERLKEKVLLGQRPITDYVEITPVNSDNVAVGSIANASDAVFYNLTVKDDGTYSDLGLVQSQVSNFKVVRSDSTSTGSVYTIVAEKDIITAGAFVTGQTYVIETVGTTDFTLIGASANTVGIEFTATGAGTGTGTAYVKEVTTYVQNDAWQVKGCADCPAGYSELEDGFVYSIGIEDDGADSTATIEAISANAVASSAVKVSEEGGFSTYTVVIDAELTDAEKTAFTDTNNEAVIELVSRDVSEVCSPDNSTSTSWVVGDTCKLVTEEYSIIVPDDECGSPVTAALQAAYPELTITAGSSVNCSTKFTTDVTSNVVCEECAEDFRDLFITEAPKNYGVHPWKKAAKTYDFDAKMGIRVKAKPFIFVGDEEYRDYVPDLATSTRIQLAGGYTGTVTESFSEGSTDGRFALTVLSVGSEPENWGVNLRDWEEAGRVYFDGYQRFYQNNYGNFAAGNETNLDAIQPYVDYVLKVRKKSRTQAFYGELNETIEYHITCAPGVHSDVESVLNALAAEAGVKTVQAFGKTTV